MWRGLLAFISQNVELQAAVPQKTHLTSKTSTETYRARFWKKWNVFKNLCTVFIPGLLPVSGTQGSDSQGNLPFSWINVPFPLDGRSPQSVRRSWLLLCCLFSGRETSPALSQAVTENRTRGVHLTNDCQSWRRAASAGSLSCLWWCDLFSCASPQVPFDCSEPMTQISSLRNS